MITSPVASGKRMEGSGVAGGMSGRRALWATLFALFALFAVAYARLAPNIFRQEWESLMYAHGAEVNGVHAILGNHPLGHFVLNSVYALLQALGYQGKALPVHIILNSLAGGAIVACFFFTVNRLLRLDFVCSLGLSLILGASYKLWSLSGSGEIYTVSTLTLLLAWASLIYSLFDRNCRHLYLSGCLAGLSLLSHQLNGVFFIVAAGAIVAMRRDYRTRLLSFFGSGISVAVVGFVLLGSLALSSFSVTDIYEWMRGYVGDPVFGDGLTLDSIPRALEKASATILAPVFGRARFIRLFIFYAVIGSVLLGLSQLKLLDRKRQLVLVCALAQCVVSWPLIVWFMPSHHAFWLLTLVPGMLAVACSVEAIQSRLSVWLKARVLQELLGVSAVLVGFAIVGMNLRYAIVDEHKPDPLSEAALADWLNRSHPDDMLLTGGDLIPQLWYWGNRPRTVHLYHYLVVDKRSDDRFEYLRGEMRRTLCSGGKVLIAPVIADNFLSSFLGWLDLSREELRWFIDGLPKEEYFRYRNGLDGRDTQVYSVLAREMCAGVSPK